MNAEKVLEQALKIKSWLSEEQQKAVDYMLTERTTGNLPFGELARLILDAKDEIVSGNAKKGGRKAVLDLAKMILKSAEKQYSQNIKGAFYNDGDDHQYYLDAAGSMLLRVKKRLDLPEVPKDVETVNVSHITDWNTSKMRELPEIPSPGELKAYIAEAKATGNVEQWGIIRYELKGGPVVDANKLLPMLKAFTNGKLYCRGWGKVDNGMLFVYDNEEDEGVFLLGLRRL